MIELERRPAGKEAHHSQPTRSIGEMPREAGGGRSKSLQSSGVGMQQRPISVGKTMSLQLGDQLRSPVALRGSGGRRMLRWTVAGHGIER